MANGKDADPKVPRRSERLRNPTEKALFESVDRLAYNLDQMLINPHLSGDQVTVNFVRYLKISFAKFENESRCLEKKLNSGADVELRHEYKRNRYLYVGKMNAILDLCKKKMKSDVDYDIEVFDLMSDRASLQSAIVAAEEDHNLSETEETITDASVLVPQVPGQDVVETAVSSAPDVSNHPRPQKSTTNTDNSKGTFKPLANDNINLNDKDSSVPSSNAPVDSQLDPTGQKSVKAPVGLSLDPMAKPFLNAPISSSSGPIGQRCQNAPVGSRIDPIGQQIQKAPISSGIGLVGHRVSQSVTSVTSVFPGGIDTTSVTYSHPQNVLLNPYSHMDNLAFAREMSAKFIGLPGCPYQIWLAKLSLLLASYLSLTLSLYLQ